MHVGELARNQQWMDHEWLTGRPFLGAVAFLGELKSAPQGSQIIAGTLLGDLCLQFPVETFHRAIPDRLCANRLDGDRPWRDSPRGDRPIRG